MNVRGVPGFDLLSEEKCFKVWSQSHDGWRALRNSLHRVTSLSSQSAKEQRVILLHEHGQVQLLWGQSHMTTNETLSPHNIFTGSTLTTTTAKTSSNTHEQTYENFQCLKVDLGINFVKVSHIICHPVA